MSVNIAVKWADNTKDLKAALQEGTDAIYATKAATDKLVQAFSGDKLIEAAHRMVAAIGEVGGAEKLTNAERDRTNALLDKAIQKYAALGKEAPSAMRALFEETQKVTTATSALVDGMSAAGKQSQASITLIGGMSQAGRDAATVLSKEVVPATTNWGGALKDVSGLMGAFGVSMSAAAVVGFGKTLLADADALTHLSDRTGVSTEWLQRFQTVTDDTGDSLEGLAGSVNKLQKNIGANDPQAIAAIEELGLSYQALKDLAPEQQFIQVADALRKVTDQNRQVALGTDLMGRGFVENLATIRKGFDDVKNAAPDMSEATVKALDDMGDAAQRMWRQFKGEGATFLAWMAKTFPAAVDDSAKALDAALERMRDSATKNLKGFPSMPSGGAPVLPKETLKDLEAQDALFGDQRKNYDRQIAAAEAYRQKLDALNEKIREATRDIGHLSDAQQDEAIRLEKLGLSAEDIGFKLKVSGEAVRRFLDFNNELEKELERITTHVSASAIPAFTGLTLTWQQMLNTGRGLTYDGLIPMAKGFDDVSRAELASKLYTDDLTKSHVALQNQLGRTIGLMPDLSSAAREHFKEAGGAATEFTNVFEDALKDLPTIMQHAFEGGGGLEGAAKSLGTKLANDVIASYAAQMKAAGTKVSTSQQIATGAGTAGGAAVGGGLGGPTGAMIGSIASSVGGAALIAGGAFGGAAAGVGGAIALGATTAGIGAAAVGVYLLAKHFLTVSQNEKDARDEFAKLQDLYGSLPDTIKGVGDAYALMGYSGERAQADIKRALDASHDSAQAEDAALRPILDVLAAAAQRTEDLGKANETVKTSVDGLTEAGQAFGGHVPDQFKAAVRELANMKGVTDDERKALLALSADVKPNFEELTKTAEKYGITLEGLGKSFQQANIEGRAKDITSDFEALTKAGGDAGGILAGMADEISNLVNDSKKFGTAIPENMRPLIDELLRAGKLTDENGNKLEDVSNITFEATPIDDSMTKLATAIDNLTKSLENLATLQIPPIQVPVTYVGTGPVTPPQNVPVPAYATGSGGFKDFGTGTLAVLHGREAVITESQALRSDYTVSSSASSPAAAADVHVSFTISTLDATDFQTVVEQKVFPALVNQLRRGRGLTAMKDVLG